MRICIGLDIIFLLFEYYIIYTFILSVCLTGYIQASRALMIAAVVMGTLGLVCTLVGMQCSKAGGDNLVLKGRIAGTGGVFFLLQGKNFLHINYYSFINNSVGFIIILTRKSFSLQST